MKKILSILLIMGMLFLLISCKTPEKVKLIGYYVENDKPLQFAFHAFDTNCSISLYMDEENQEWCQTYADDIINYIRQYEDIFSKTKEDSDIYNVNHRGTDSVMISDSSANLFEIARDLYTWSGKCFDVSAGTLIDLWDIKNRKTIPTLQEINEARSHCGNFQYTIERDVAPDDLRSCRITFSGDKKTQYDFGGLVKGYCCDGIRSMLLTNDKINAAIVNLGGNVCCYGKLESRVGGAFNIGIYKPFPKGTTSEIVDTVKIIDKNVITSGNYQRYFKIPGDDRIYHHIIDPRTGYPSENGYNSVTIISENGLLGDYLSTTGMMVTDMNYMKDLIDFCQKQFKDKNIQAIFCDNDDKIIRYPKSVKTY